MQIEPPAQAILLLTASLHAEAASGGAKPLTNTEYARLARWLQERHLSPESLLTREVERILSAWRDEKISGERLTALLGRGAALALALEKWLGANLWVLTRADAQYPDRLKGRLRYGAPPVLYGSGRRELLNSGGVAVVGSRNVGEEGVEVSRQIGQMAAGAGLTVVSGGARGVDESAMQGALAVEGTVVGVLPDSLLRRSSEKRYRRHLVAGDLVLVSPFSPESRFHVGQAMGRNRYIYCLSDAAIVVCSGLKGGTWTGARENLRHGWVPIWSRLDPDQASGTGDLIRQGARELPDQVEDIDFTRLKDGESALPVDPGQLRLFGEG